MLDEQRVIRAGLDRPRDPLPVLGVEEQRTQDQEVEGALDEREPALGGRLG